MTKAAILLLILSIVIILIWLIPSLRKIQRRQLKKQKLSCLGLAIIEQNIPFYNRLSKVLQHQLQEHIKVFLAEKQFIGCGGLELTDEIKLIIATQACLLLLNENGNYYPHLNSILVYPSSYKVKATTSIGNFYVEEREEVRLGESWNQGQIVLAWEQIKYDTKNWNDGHNVVLHEFAHQLDQEDGSVNGVPLLEGKSDYISWSQVLSKEYQRLKLKVEQGTDTVIDEYGATNPAEFFAVATETFFEKPKQMKRDTPELYQELKRYYKLDPAGL